MPARRFLARFARLGGWQHGWLIAIAITYLFSFPYFPRIHSANELPRVYLTQAIVDDHTLAIDRGVATWGGTADVSPSNGHQYSNKAPGSSILVAPVYAAIRVVAPRPSLGFTLWLCRLVGGILPTLAFLWLLWGFLARAAPDPDIRRLVLLGYGLGSMAMTYSILFYSHQLGAVCVGSAWILAVDVVERRRGFGSMAAAGALAGAAMLADYQAVFAAVPVAVYVVVKLWSRSRRDLGQAIAYAVAGAAAPIIILLAYHTVCFGSPWRTGYDASTTFAQFHQQGFLGITKLRWEAFTGSFVRPDNGLITLAPWWLLSIPGAVVLARRGRDERALVATSAAVVVIYVLFISSINFWRGGWGVGPRYITAMLPFLLPMVAAQLQAWRDRPLVLGLAAGTLVVGITIYVLSSLTFPYWPDSVANPLYDITFHLLADGLVAPNALTAIGLGGVITLVPVLVLVILAFGAPLVRIATWRAALIAAAVAAVIIGAYVAFPRNAHETAHAYAFVTDAVNDVLKGGAR